MAIENITTPVTLGERLDEITELATFMGDLFNLIEAHGEDEGKLDTLEITPAGFKYLCEVGRERSNKQLSLIEGMKDSLLEESSND